MIMVLGANYINNITIFEWAKPNPAFGSLSIDFHFDMIGLFA